MTTQTEALKMALEALENNKQTHYYCEDTWYSCPQHEDGCANDSVGDECNCGADKANAEIDKAITAIKEALQSNEQVEPFGIWHQGATEDESDFYLYKDSGDVSCPDCIKLYTRPPVPTAQPKEPEQNLKLMPREATPEMLKAMDECSTEGYDERLYEGHAGSVYMAAWDAFYGQHCYCGDITNLGVIHRDDGPCHYPDRKESEPEPVAFPDAPKTIYLQVGDECPEDAKWKELIDVCWCDEQVFDNDIVYVRADTTPPQRTWVGLTDDEEMDIALEQNKSRHWVVCEAIRQFKEKNQ